MTKKIFVKKIKIFLDDTVLKGFSATKITKKMKTYSVKIDEELASKIAIQAKKEDRSESSVIRQALRFFFLNIKIQPKYTKNAPQN